MNTTYSNLFLGYLNADIYFSILDTDNKCPPYQIQHDLLLNLLKSLIRSCHTVRTNYECFTGEPFCHELCPFSYNGCTFGMSSVTK